MRHRSIVSVGFFANSFFTQALHAASPLPFPAQTASSNRSVPRASVWSAPHLRAELAEPGLYRHPRGRMGAVAQTSSLLCRGFPIRMRWEVRKPCRLEVGDTAGWKPALLPLYEMCVKCRSPL